MKGNSSRGGALVAGLGFGGALGVLIGALVLGQAIPGFGGSSSATTETTTVQAAPNDQATNNKDQGAEDFYSHQGPELVKNSLAKRPVLILEQEGATATGAVRDQLKAAGAVDSGTITLKDSMFAQDSADKLSAVATSALPAGTNLPEDNSGPGSKAGLAMGQALFFDPKTAQQRINEDQRETFLHALRDSGFINYQDKTIRPGQEIIIVTKDPKDAQNRDFYGNMLNSLAGGMKKQGNGMTVVGPGAAGIDSIFSVTNVDSSCGRAAMVMSLSDQLRIDDATAVGMPH